MSSKDNKLSAKPMSEKQRLKMEKFALKKEKQAQNEPSGASKENKSKKQNATAMESKDWVEETPAGERKILKPLDDDFHKAYSPKVVESAWYSFWEDQDLFKPQTEKDGSLKPKGKYVIAIPPPNVWNLALRCRDHILTPVPGNRQTTHRTRTGAFIRRLSHQMASYATIFNSIHPWLRSRRYRYTSCC
jgi:hypothetical protein